jgi:hypothetical protein
MKDVCPYMVYEPACVQCYKHPNNVTQPTEITHNSDSYGESPAHEWLIIFIPNDSFKKSQRFSHLTFPTLRFVCQAAMTHKQNSSDVYKFVFTTLLSMWDLWCTKWHWDRFFPRVHRFSPVNFIPPVLHYKEK